MVLLENLLRRRQLRLKKDNLAAILNRFDDSGANQIMVEPGSPAVVSKYGIVDCEGAALTFGQSCKVSRVVVKKQGRLVQSSRGRSLCFIGRYLGFARPGRQVNFWNTHG